MVPSFGLRTPLPPVMAGFLNDAGRDDLANPQGRTWTADGVITAVAAAAHLAAS